MSLPHVTFTVWSDVLCPWCYNVAVCLDRLQEEVRGEVKLDLVWKSYLLRPNPEPRTLEKFRRYTESWMRPASQPDAGEFRVWASDEGPPSHSVPSAIAVKAAALQETHPRYHLALMNAYFARNLDVTSVETIVRIAEEWGLDIMRFEKDLDDEELVREVASDHKEAVERDITGVPCVVLDGGFALPGSQDRGVYRNIIQRLVARQEAS